MAMNWNCPHCDRAQTLVDKRQWSTSNRVEITDHALDEVLIYSSVFACSNPVCKKLSITTSVWAAEEYIAGGSRRWKGKGDKPIVTARLIPESHAKPQPAYIPQAIRDDYFEACRIRDLSPKASATLARRCLQGMIRDFCQISKATLFKEIEALRKAVDDGTAPRDIAIESVDAIDHVRSIGNIGAHMEKDVNVIVDVDAGEAQVLIELIESLFDEWYSARHKRHARFAQLKAIAEAKAEAKADATPGGSE